MIRTIVRLIPEKYADNTLITALLVLTSDSAVYLMGNILLGLGNFIIVPLYIRSLTPSDFGIYVILDIAILLVVTMTQIGLTVSYLRWFTDSFLPSHGQLLGTTLAVGAICSTFGGISLLLIFTTPIAYSIFGQPVNSIIWTLPLIVVLENLQGLLISDLRAQRRAVAFSLTALVRTCLIVTSTILLLGIYSKGLAGVFLGRLIADTGAVMILLLLCVAKTSVEFSPGLAIRLVNYGYPIALCSLISFFLDASGRILLGYYSTLDQVGLYGAAIKISNAFQIIISQPIRTAFGGIMFQIAKMPNARITYSKIYAYLFAFSTMIVLSLSLAGPTLFHLFTTEEYLPAVFIFPLVLLAQSISLQEIIAPIGIYLKGQTHLFPFIYSTGLLLNLAANFILIPVYGSFGAAWAWIAGWVLIVTLLTYFGQRHYQLHHDTRFMLFPIGLLAGFLLTYRQIFTHPLYLQIAIAAIFTLLYTGWLIMDALNTIKVLSTRDNENLA
jgi:O-antigen/teichoic acid export membrane protein